MSRDNVIIKSSDGGKTPWPYTSDSGHISFQFGSSQTPDSCHCQRERVISNYNSCNHAFAHMETTNYTITVNRYDHGVVNNLAVDPQFLGHGFGRTLVQAAEEFLRGIGCAKINLCVRRENEAVIKFYDKLGYAEETVYYSGKRLIEDQQQPRIFAPIG